MTGFPSAHHNHGAGSGLDATKSQDSLKKFSERTSSGRHRDAGWCLHFAMRVARGRISRVTSQRNEANGEGVSPFVELDRQTWSRLAAQMEQPLNEEDVLRLRGLGDPLDLKEVREVYLPLSRLLHLCVEAANQL